MRPVPTTSRASWLRRNSALARVAERVHKRVEEALGDPARVRPILVMAAVLGLDGADKGAVSAMAGPLQDAFGVHYTAIGLLVSVTSFVAAAFTIPIGLVTDRVVRTRLLAVSVALWAVAMLLSATAPTYVWLLVSRAALGAVAATAGPTVASLIGDFFPAHSRARMWGFILGGELIGTGLGFAVSGSVGSSLGWRYAFAWLILPAVALAWALLRLPEPARGKQERLSSHSPAGEPHSAGGTGEGTDLAEQATAHAGVQPVDRIVLHTDPRSLPPWRNVLYVLRVRTNLVLIAASALGYFFFAGLRAFATVFTTDHYGVSTSVASSLVLVLGAGAVCGVLVGGRLADRMLERGRVNARIIVPVVCLLAVSLLLAPAIHTSSLAIALPLLVCGTIFLGAVNPPLDAARLDIMPHMLWGTAEGVRTMLRTLCEAVAPTLLGYIAGHLFGGQQGLEYALLLFLIPLIAASFLGMLAMGTYPRDVATADASATNVAELVRGDGGEDGDGR